MSYVLSAAVFLVVEILLYFSVFKLLGRIFLRRDRTTPNDVTFEDFAKGVIERGVVAFGLYLGYPHVLTLFGAMKLGTRLKSEPQTPEYNNFYLIGNLVSVLVAMIYSRTLPPESPAQLWLIATPVGMWLQQIPAATVQWITAMTS